MRWSRVSGDVETWELFTRYSDGPRWTVYRVKGEGSCRNPGGEYWRATRDGTVLRANQRVRSWLSRHAAMGAVEELERLGL